MLLLYVIPVSLYFMPFCTNPLPLKTPFYLPATINKKTLCRNQQAQHYHRIGIIGYLDFFSSDIIRNAPTRAGDTFAAAVDDFVSSQ